ncbi:MAG: hypothetical protein P0Y53_02685 [Candidatus Pseudobacter hemicellulosilyticus]|uniref:Tetratricopeptide repeat protein n=1 Tax=Candidatus Pseudobacter hemicellulosilyticus TaxID=3121375 RepID=A0AAJ6BI08_9BACT|nr:MAG: hypothetical protein P0Y53_02685 [Pseudobacter sp.]
MLHSSLLRRGLLACAFIVLAGHAMACINEYTPLEPPRNYQQKLDLHQLLHPVNGQPPYWQYGFAQSPALLARKAQLEQQDPARMHFQDLSDRAAIELRLGNTATALPWLEQLYRDHPHEYTIVANLATAYELNGQPRRALELIREAIRLNPQAHGGSEWIHGKILEQQVSARPDYRQVINLDPNNFPNWILDKKIPFPVAADSLKQQLAFQLHERIALMPAPDSIIGQLLFDFADILAKTEARRDTALPFYALAVHYYPRLASLATQRQQDLVAEKKEVTKTFTWASIFWAIPLGILAFVLLAWLKSQRDLKREQRG